MPAGQTWRVAMELTGTVGEVVRLFVIETFVMGQVAPEELHGDTDLVDIGLLDSMNVLQLVDFLEERFDFQLESEDLLLLTTIDGITALVLERTAG